MITHWLVTSWHWVIIVGIILAILGACYVGYDFLNLRILQGLTQGFTYGIVGGILGGLPIAIVLTFFLLLTIVLLLIEEIFIPGTFASAHVYNSILATFSLSLTCMIFGIVIGFLTGIASIRLEEASVLMKIFNWRNIFLLFLLSILCIILYSVFMVFSNQSDSVILLIVSFYGFALGTLYGRVGFAWIKWAIGFTCAFIAIVVLLKLGYFSVNFNNILIDSLILVSILIFCLLSGYVFFNQPQFYNPYLDKGSWRKFALWLVVGWICGFALLLLSHLLLMDVTGFILPASAIGTLVAFGNGEAKRLLNERRPKARPVAQGSEEGRNPLYPVLSWARFRRGFSIAFIFASMVSSLLYYNLFSFDPTVYNSLANIFKQVPDLYPSIDFYVKFAGIFVSLVFGLAGGLITAIIYGYGYVLLYKAERLPKKRLGQIGLGFTVLGIVVMALPSLIS